MSAYELHSEHELAAAGHDDPKSILGRQPRGSVANVTIANASLVIEPRDWKAWLRAQLVSINLSNFILLITVLIVTSSLKGQLDTAQQQVQSANAAIEQLKQTTQEAKQVFSQLDANRALLTEFNRTLEWAVNEGLPNLTRLEQRNTRVSVPLQNVAYESPASWSAPYSYSGGALTIVFSGQGYVSSAVGATATACSMTLMIDGVSVSVASGFCDKGIRETLFTAVSSPFPNLPTLQPGMHQLEIRPMQGLEMSKWDHANIIVIEVN